MARRRTTEEPAPFDVRAELAAKYRRLGYRFDGLGAGTGEPAPGAGPFHRLADALEAGEPVELYAWQLPRWLPDRPRAGRVLLDP